MRVGEVIFRPNIGGGTKIYEYTITDINISNGGKDVEIIVNDSYHYDINDIENIIFLSHNEAQEKLDAINEKKYLEYPMLKGA